MFKKDEAEVLRKKLQKLNGQHRSMIEKDPDDIVVFFADQSIVVAKPFSKKETKATGMDLLKETSQMLSQQYHEKVYLPMLKLYTDFAEEYGLSVFHEKEISGAESFLPFYAKLQMSHMIDKLSGGGQ